MHDNIKEIANLVRSPPLSLRGVFPYLELSGNSLWVYIGLPLTLCIL